MSTMRAVQFEVGAIENMFIGTVDVPALKQKHVLVKVMATAINRADTLQV